MAQDDVVLDLSNMTTVSCGGAAADTIDLDWSSTFATDKNSDIWTSGLFAIGDHNISSGSINLQGPDADVIVNGVSLNDTLRGIQQRLNLLRPNPEMEAQWDELRELGQRYRELEQQCMEKSRMWNHLTSMPPPEIS